MFERFTEKAIKVIMLAQEESRRLGHNFVGTEQMLLGLIREESGMAGRILRSMGVNLKQARREVEKIIGRGSGHVAVEIPFTPRGKRVLELSLKESRKHRHRYIGTEHLLLGLIQEREGVAARVLENLGINLQELRDRIIQAMSELPDAQSNDIEDTAGRKLSKLVMKIDQLIESLSDALTEATEMSDHIKSEIRERSALSSDVESAIAQLPDSPESEQPGIKELLTQLQSAIAADSNLNEQDKAEAIEQLFVLAEVADDSQDDRMRKFARTALKILRGTVAELPSTSELVQACASIFPAIAKYFNL
jgi:ATP-dependent Clp protease ATP-binding subunit ClpA